MYLMSIIMIVVTLIISFAVIFRPKGLDPNAFSSIEKHPIVSEKDFTRGAVEQTTYNQASAFPTDFGAYL